jgi:hypothetical protein
MTQCPDFFAIDLAVDLQQWIGILMSTLNGAEITHEELDELTFD